MASTGGGVCHCITRRWLEPWICAILHQEQGSISVQALSTLKTRAKDDQGKTYWIYPNDDVTMAKKKWDAPLRMTYA